MMIPRSLRLGILLAGLAATSPLVPARADGPPDRTQFTLRLKRGDFIVYRFVPGDPKFAQHPRAVVIFGSGDGGFDGSEDHVGHALESQGYEMLGFDCSAYADTDYDLATLQQDTTTIAESSLSHYGPNPPPLILGGWSMGAAQAVAAAGGPHPPPGVVGLLLLSPEDRGRYGVRETDRIDVPPTGPGTFALEDFAQNLGHIRVAQWSASWDPFCSDTWLRSLTAPHKAFILPHAFHDYDEFDDEFMKVLMDSVAWILSPGTPADATAKNGGP